MTSKDIDKIIEKYLQGKATQEEINHLNKLEQFAANRIKNKVFYNESERKTM